MRHKHLSKSWLIPKHAHNGSFLEPHDFAFGDCHNRCQAQRLTGQTAFAKKITLTLNADDRFFSLIGANGDFDLAFSDVKDGICKVVLAEDHQMTKRAGEAFLGDLVSLITQHLKKGERIRIAGLGILQVRKRAARMGRNPGTGEAIKIKASKKVAFRPSKELKLAV